MKNLTIEIDNLKCEGCANTISKQLKKIKGVDNVVVDNKNATVTITYHGEINKTAYIESLTKIGYPPKGTSNSIQKVKSYVSCAVGKIS